MRTRPTPRRHGAIQTLELLLIFPILMAIFFGTVEYGLMLAAEARLTNASREGARVAAAGGNLADVTAAVKLALPGNEQNKVDVLAVLADGSGTALSASINPGDPIGVQVNAWAAHLVPDYLRFIGISICGKCLSGQTVMRKE